MSQIKLQIAPGQMFGVYRAMEFIARGGFSEVWSAWDTQLNRLVAIKLLARTPNDHTATMMFGREAAAIAQLKHRYIVPLYDYGQTADVRYLVTRYVIGGSLAQMITRKQLELTTQLSLMRCVAEALDHAHAQHVVHRDLKPGNILVDAYDVAYLTDFGLAYQLEEGTPQIHSASGTPPYMPPEQLTGGEVTVYSDQFSFGIMLFQLLTGELPFEGKLAFGLQQIKTGEKLPDPASINPDLPSELAPILWSLTALDPASRPATLLPVIETVIDVLRSQDRTLVLSAETDHEALDSRRYLEAERLNLLDQSLPDWEHGDFVLSLTHFVLLNVLIGDERGKQSAPVQSLMLRGALEYDQQIHEWWAESGDPARQRACFHALKKGDNTVRLRTLPLITPTTWPRLADAETLTAISTLLMPVSDSTPVALDFFERTLPPSATWTEDTHFVDADRGLAALANTNSPHARRAAALIGQFRRTRALDDVSSLSSRLTAYEAAGSLPKRVPVVNWIILTIPLVFRQLTAHPVTTMRHYLWAALGCVAALGWLIYEVYRSTDPLANRRILNTLGLALMFGLIYGLAVWSSRHIMENARIIPRGLRLVLAITIGAVVFAVGANLFQGLVYDDVLDRGIALLSGALFVGGFAVSVGMREGIQFVAGASGVIAALLIPWSYYLADGTAPPFYFDYTDPNSAIPLTLIAATVLSATALGLIGSWMRKWIRSTTLQASPIMPDAPETTILPH